MHAFAVKNQARASLVPMLIIGSLFFIFGFVTWLNGALIPFLQIVCQLTETQSLFIAFSFYIAYTVMALPMAAVLERSGYKNGISLGLGLIAAGCLGFIPAAQSQTFTLFLLAQFVVGSGLTILQTASNPYIVHIGPVESAAARISVMGLLNKGAGVLAPLVFTALVLGDFADFNAKSLASLSDAERQLQINALADGLVLPYLGLAIVLIALALALRVSPLPPLAIEQHKVRQTQTRKTHHILRFPQLVLGALTLFCYVGVEVIAGDTFGLFGSKLGVENATSLTSYTMAFMVLGYLLGLLLIPRVIRQERALAWSAACGLLLSLAVVNSSSESTWVSAILWGWLELPLLPNTVTFVAMLGLANALVWPAVWPLALKDLGPYTATGSALLIMGIAGGALLPLVYGLLSDAVSNQWAYWMMLPCYGVIGYFALFGHKKRIW